MQVLCISWCDWSAYVMWPDVAAAHSTQPSLHWTDGEQPFTKYEPLHLHLLESRESRTRHLLACFWEHICCRSWESTTHLFDMPSSPYKDTVVRCTAMMSIVPFQTQFKLSVYNDRCLGITPAHNVYSGFPQNVEYVEMSLPQGFPLHLRRFLPNVFCSSWTADATNNRWTLYIHMHGYTAYMYVTDARISFEKTLYWLPVKKVVSALS